MIDRWIDRNKLKKDDIFCISYSKSFIIFVSKTTSGRRVVFQTTAEPFTRGVPPDSVSCYTTIASCMESGADVMGVFRKCRSLDFSIKMHFVRKTSRFLFHVPADGWERECCSTKVIGSDAHGVLERSDLFVLIFMCCLGRFCGAFIEKYYSVDINVFAFPSLR